MSHFRIHARQKGGFDSKFFDGCQLKTGADIPVPIRETIVTIRVRHTSIGNTVVQVPETEERATPPFSLYFQSIQLGGNPLCSATQTIHPDSHLGKDGSRNSSPDPRDHSYESSTTNQQR